MATTTTTTTTQPPISPDLLLWILDFILRQPIPDPLLKDLFPAITPAIPIDNSIATTSSFDPNLHRVQKAILFRCIRSDLSLGAISDRTLSSLDLLRQFDHNVPPKSSSSIWQPRTLTKEVEGSTETRSEVDPTTKNALRSVGEYVRDAEEEMGLPFLEIKAAEYLRQRGDGLARHEEAVEGGRGRGATEESETGERRGLDELERAEASCFEFGGGSFCGLDRERARRALEQELRAEDKPSENSVDERNAVAFGNTTHPSPLCKRMHTPDVIKVKQALKISCKDLYTVVEDPLPAAVTMAADVVASLSEKATNVNELQHCKNNVGDDTDDIHGGQVPDFQCTVSSRMGSLPNLMERNQTTHSYEWSDDSIDSPENSPDSAKIIRLPSPRKRKVSPLKVAEPSKLTIRRKQHKWSSLEEDTLREGVNKHGKGSWKYILNSYPTVFLERTEVDLKDKWRNMTRHR